LLRIALAIIALVVFGCAAGSDEGAVPINAPTAGATASPPPDSTQLCPIAEFFRAIAGEWVGICKQSTDGEAAEDKYFHACVRESGKSCFEARFDYYRLDTTGAPVRIGGSNVVVTVASDCTATGRVTGDGEVLVDQRSKKQEHDLTESLTWLAPDQLQGRGGGSLKVYGMPLGLGKLGKVRDDRSAWKFANGTLSIQQSLNIVFRALCFSKSFKIEASYSAVRGSRLSDIPAKQPGEIARSGE